MTELQKILIDIAVIPPIPPQPPRFVPQKLKNLTNVKSIINENTYILSLLHTQFDVLNGLANKARKRIKEYESYSQLLRYHTFSFRPSINDLPPELLAIIFEHCCTGISVNDLRAFKISSDKMPWVLSWVCSSWRQLAITTAAIWSTIPGPLEIFRHTSPVDSSFPKLEAHLSRSTPASLRVFLHCDDYSPHGESNTIFNQLAPHFGRISDLSIYCELPIGIQKLYSILSHKTPQEGLAALKSLSIEFSYAVETEFELVSPPPLFQSLPNLTNLSVRLDWEMDLYHEKLLLQVPWSQLTSFTIHHGTDYALLRNMLLQAPRLQELRVINTVQKSDPAPLRQANQIHPNLRLLHLQADFGRQDTITGFPNSGWTTPFLKGLCLPALIDFSIRDLALGASVAANFLELSQCSLLQCEYFFPDPQGLVLQQCPSITKLSLGLVKDVQLEALCCSRGGTWLVPHLKTLSLVSACVSSGVVVERLIQTRKLTPQVREIDRIEMSIRFTDMCQVDHEISANSDADDVDDADDADELTVNMGTAMMQTNYEFERHFIKRFLTTILKASCGYDLINMYNSVDRINHLGTLCNALERLKHRPLAFDHMFDERDGLIDCVVKILVHLDQIEEPDANTSAYQTRLQRLLRRWSHDPWAMGNIPAGWIRAKAVDPEDQKHVPGVLVYTAR